MTAVTKSPKHLMIMAAGTGGHIFPGLAIAEEMQERGWQVSWLGTTSGMEGGIVAEHKIPMDQINFTGLRGKGFMHTLVGMLKLLTSFFACLRFVWRREPSVVLGMGGYVTVPGGISSALLGKPLVLMNADAPLLLSNKILKPFSRKLMFGLPSLINGHNKKCVFTGNPIRREIGNMPPPQERYMNRSGPLRILVVGGSLGAKVLNESVPDALAQIPLEGRPVVTQQSGRQHVEALKKRYEQHAVQAEVLDFIDDMPRRYKEVDLVICRAGAITVSELTAAGVASILIPFVASSTSHQTANAQWLSEAGGAIYLPQNEFDANKLAGILLKMTRERCQELAVKAYQLGMRDATIQIANILEELV